MKGLFQKPLNPHRTNLQFHHARLRLSAAFSALFIRA
jgi:hypothetical protein